MKEGQKFVPAQGLVPGSHEDPEFNKDLVIKRVVTDELGRKRFEIFSTKYPEHTWQTLAIDAVEEKAYRKALDKINNDD